MRFNFWRKAKEIPVQTNQEIAWDLYKIICRKFQHEQLEIISTMLRHCDKTRHIHLNPQKRAV